MIAARELHQLLTKYLIAQERLSDCKRTLDRFTVELQDAANAFGKETAGVADTHPGEKLHVFVHSWVVSVWRPEEEFYDSLTAEPGTALSDNYKLEVQVVR